MMRKEKVTLETIKNFRYNSRTLRLKDFNLKNSGMSLQFKTNFFEIDDKTSIIKYIANIVCYEQITSDVDGNVNHLFGIFLDFDIDGNLKFVFLNSFSSEKDGDAFIKKWLNIRSEVFFKKMNEFEQLEVMLKFLTKKMRAEKLKDL